MDVQCMLQEFWQRRRPRAQGRWTWRQWRQGQWESSQTDYFISCNATRKKVRNVALWMPRHFESDHWAIIVTLHAGRKKKLKAYRRRRHLFPIRLFRYGPRSETETIFEELQAACKNPPPRELKANNWISL